MPESEHICNRCGQRAIAPCAVCGEWVCPLCFDYQIEASNCLNCREKIYLSTEEYD